MRERGPRQRPDRTAARRRSARSAAIAAVAVVAALVAVAPDAWAYLRGSGGGVLAVPVAHLEAPGAPTATAAAAGAVEVAWVPASAPVAGDVRSWVTRTDTVSGATAWACGSPAAPLGASVASCTDTTVPQGTYTYVVTVRFRTWQTTGPPSAPVTVAPWTTTSLTTTAPTVSYGDESSATWSASVATSDGSPATGTVTVASGGLIICTILLPDTGCTADDPTALGASADPQAVVATYSGDPVHPGSTSGAVGWTVTPDSTMATVSVSPTAVTYGYEQLVVVTVTVTTGHGEDLPIGGEVLNVQIGSLDLSARLSLGGGGASGACYLQYRDLTANPIPYAVTTTYAGDIDLLPSATATAPVGLTVNAPPSVTTATLPAGHRNQAYSTTLAASDGTAPLTWSLASGALPTGLALTASTGRISGTVGGTATSKTLTFRVTDASGASATRTLTLTIS